mmetsp:Transcript_3026/g.6543  ORF Transcript_3026/g.6543 Transcript_3026/m.6543 type:complete len:270 (+) Transcript_3026:1027-1836(+)
MPSHHTSPSFVSPTFVNRQSRLSVSIAEWLVKSFVPGATPKNPASGLIAHNRPSSPTCIHAISSPITRTVYPASLAAGIIMLKLVLPHWLGNAAATKCSTPAGFVNPRSRQCSAIQPCSRPSTDAMRSAMHFFARIELPPKLVPKLHTDGASQSGKCTMRLLSLLHGHRTSFWPGASGNPTECKHGTNSDSPIVLSTRNPMRVMILMLATTYGESVICTPYRAYGEPSGPSWNGITYIVRPRMLPVKSATSSRFISTGSRQLFSGPASW